MTEDEVVEQTDDQIEKEAREYSQTYIRELIAESKKYIPPTVWEHLHRKARSTAGGKASGKAKRDAATAAQEAAAQTQTIAPELTAQLQEAQAEPTKKADDDCEVAAQKCEAMKAKASKSAETKKEMAVKAVTPETIIEPLSARTHSFHSWLLRRV
jgi:Tfp pilus assembly protein FimV